MILGPDGKPARPVWTPDVRWLLEETMAVLDQKTVLHQRARIAELRESCGVPLHEGVGDVIRIRKPARYR